jgi:ABC-type antimicrobial peptide transport system permease subunit
MKEYSFSIIVFWLGLILLMLSDYIYPTLDYSKTQKVIQTISSGLIVSGVILIFKNFFEQRFKAKQNDKNKL